jgi:uncharacterized membrane protein
VVQLLCINPHQGNQDMTTLSAEVPRAISPKMIIGTIAFTALFTLTLMAGGMAMAGDKSFTYESSKVALIIHVGTVVPALLLGAVVMLMKKGTRRHKMLGRIWAVLMITTAISSFWLRGINGSVGPIHIFAVVSLVSIARAVYCIRKGDIAGHQGAMTGCYAGLLVAGLFSFMPGRLMANLVAAWF